MWYFTPYYSILRATTAEFMYVLALAVVLYVVLILRTARSGMAKLASVIVGLVLLAGFFAIDAKVWGVVLMGLATLIFFLLPWLDRSPVKSIRYKGGLYKGALSVFVIAFLVLGYYGTQPVTDLGTRISQFFTLLYFAFFLLMPWFSRMDATRPPPARLTH